MDGKDLDIELDSTADSEKEDSEEEEDDDPFSNAPPRHQFLDKYLALLRVAKHCLALFSIA